MCLRFSAYYLNLSVLQCGQNGLLIGELCFMILTERTNSAARAQEKCKLHGATLALVKTREVYDQVMIFVEAYQDGQAIDVWLGATYNVRIIRLCHYDYENLKFAH